METLVAGIVAIVAIAGASVLVRLRIKKIRRSRQRAKRIIEMFA
jgi:hypothetical protein